MPRCIAKYITFLICVTSLSSTFAFLMKGNCGGQLVPKVTSRKHTRRKKGPSRPGVGILLFLIGAFCSLPISESTNVYLINMWRRFKVERSWLQADGLLSRNSQKRSKAGVPSGFSRDGAKCRESRVAKDKDN